MIKKIDNENIGLRLDKYLTEELKESRNLILKNIKSGNILVNNNIVKGGYLLKLNDEVSVGDLTIDTSVVAEDIPLDICYEDDYIMIVNKPSGMVVHPGNGNYSSTLVNALKGYTENLSDEQGDARCGIVHRIDKDTSGLLLIAKTNEAHKILSDGFKNKIIKRKYIALVHGIISANIGKISAPIGRSLSDRKKMCVIATNSKKAVTNFKVLDRYKNATLLELTLETGRTHQIRVHLDYIGHPVVNDPMYGRRKIINNYGQMLHAEYLGFNHPITNEWLEFSVTCPKEFNDILETFKDS